MGNLTKNKLMDVRLHMDMCTEGPEVLEEIIDYVYPLSSQGTGIMQCSGMYFSVCDKS